MATLTIRQGLNFQFKLSPISAVFKGQNRERSTNPKLRRFQPFTKRFYSEDTNSDNKNGMKNLRQVISKLETLGSPKLAGSWDNVGLLVEPSCSEKAIKKVMITNDLSNAVCEEALREKVDLVLSYHPLIFAGMKRLTQSGWKDRIVIKCIENGIAVYSPHTVYDTIKDGIADWLLKDLGAGQIKPVTQGLSLGYPDSLSHRVEIRSTEILDLTGVSGIRLEKVDGSGRMIINAPESSLNQIIQISKSAGVADSDISVFKMEKHPAEGQGMGRFVKLETPLSLGETIAKTKRLVGADKIRVAYAVDRNNDSPITTVASCAGSGSSVLRGFKADLWITGEMSHHELLDANHKGISVILCEHSNSERGWLFGPLRDKISGLLNEEDGSERIEVVASKVDKDPVSIV